MPILCKPAVGVPEHVVTMAQTLAVAARLHADHPQLGLALRLIRNTGVRYPVERYLHLAAVFQCDRVRRDLRASVESRQHRFAKLRLRQKYLLQPHADHVLDGR